MICQIPSRLASGGAHQGVWAVGLGVVARKMVPRLHAFKMKLLYTKRTRLAPEEEHERPVDQTLRIGRAVTLEVRAGPGPKGPQVSEILSVDSSTAQQQPPRRPRPERPIYPPADRAAVDAARRTSNIVAVDSLELLSPVTAPCRVVAQMTNFASHVRDAGMDPKTVPLTFFRKSSASISGP